MIYKTDLCSLVPGIVVLRESFRLRLFYLVFLTNDYPEAGIQYNQATPFEVRVQGIVGWGTSIKAAEEAAAAGLLESRQYCVRLF